MGTLTNYATSKLVDHVLKAAYSPVATLYMALCTTAPTVTSTGTTITATETDYTNYARKSFTASTTFGAAALRKVIQAADIEFAQAGGVSASNITHYAILDAATNGNLLAFGSFNSAWNVVNGNTPKIPSGEIEIAIGASTNGFTDLAVHLMLDLMFRTVAWSTPSATIHFGLATATISDSDTMATITECSGNAYAREPVPASSIDAAVAGETTNSVAITFDTPSGTWGLVTSFFIVDDLSGTAGVLLAFDNTNIVDQTPTTGDTVQFEIGAFDCDLD